MVNTSVVFLNAFRGAVDELGACLVFLRLRPLFRGSVGVRMPLSDCIRDGEIVSVGLASYGDKMWRQTCNNQRIGIRRLDKLKSAPLVDDWRLDGKFARMCRQTTVGSGLIRATTSAAGSSLT